MKRLPPHCSVGLVMMVVGLLCISIDPALGQLFGKPSRGIEEAGTPRLSIPSGHLLARGRSSASYTYRGASYEGRDMSTNQYSVAVGLTPTLELTWDRHSIDVEGRTKGNRFDARATGWRLRYGRELFGNDAALFLGYRRSRAKVVQGGNVRIPPRSRTYDFGATASHPIGKKTDLHILGSGARAKVGPNAAWIWTLGGGVDHEVARDLKAQANFAFFKETGDVSSSQIAISGGLHFENRQGIYADIMGTFLPNGTPLAGDPLADGSVFILDPVFRNEPIVQDLQDDSLGFYTLRVGWTTRF